jgi:hypothetical protein
MRLCVFNVVQNQKVANCFAFIVECRHNHKLSFALAVEQGFQPVKKVG